MQEDFMISFNHIIYLTTQTKTSPVWRGIVLPRATIINYITFIDFS